MIVDTSALIAILFAEPDAERYLEALLDAKSVWISAASALEVSNVAVGRDGPKIEAEVDSLFVRCGIQVVPLDGDKIAVARQAFLAFGKCRRPARLNFGDCFSYALAKSRGEPLLYKGNDFAKTDLASAL
jgi:ribonuclease VapC